MAWAFGELELDEHRFELLRAGNLVELGPKALDLLLYLIRNRTRIATKQELLDTLWPDAVVSEDSLTQTMKLLRRAVGDTGDAQNVIETVRGRGYRFVAPIQEHVPGATRPRTSRHDQLFDRAEAMQHLATCLAAGSEGKGSVTCVLGEPGIGKTRLLEEAAMRCQAEGWVVLRARGWAKAAPPYFLMQQVLRELSSVEVASTLQTERIHELAAQIRSENGETSGSTPTSPPDLAHALRTELTRLTAQRPCLLLLDDAHWGDAESLQACAWLASRTVARMVVLVAYSSGLATGEPAQALGELARRAHATLCIKRLSRDHTGAMIEALVGHTPSPAAVDSVYERTRGNPLFIVQLVRAFGTTAETLAAVGSSAVLEEGLRAAISQQLAAVSPECRALLCDASVFGIAFDLATLAALTETTPLTILPVLEEAYRAQILRRGRERTPSFAFVHPLVRDALYREISEDRRAALHFAVGHALVAYHDGAIERHLSEVSMHFARGIAAGGASLAMEYSARAASAAAIEGRHAEAAAAYARALAAARLGSRDRSREMDLALGAAEAWLAANDPAQARESFEVVLTLGSSAVGDSRIARALLGIRQAAGELPARWLELSRSTLAVLPT